MTLSMVHTAQVQYRTRSQVSIPCTIVTAIYRDEAPISIVSIYPTMNWINTD